MENLKEDIISVLLKARRVAKIFCLVGGCSAARDFIRHVEDRVCAVTSGTTSFATRRDDHWNCSWQYTCTLCGYV